MKMFKTISILAVLLLIITCMMVLVANPAAAVDTTPISTAGNTQPTQNPLTDLTWLIITAAVSALSGKFFSWLSKRLTTAKYVPKSVLIWLDQIDEQDVANAITEARKLVGMTPAERIAWARKYLQDRYKQLPSSVANKLLEDKYQEIVKTPQLIR